MEDAPLNSSRHVERLREILFGRQLSEFEERLSRLENKVSSRDEGAVRELERRQAQLADETRRLREQLKHQEQLHRSQIDRLEEELESARREIANEDDERQKQLSLRIEHISSAMATRIDTRLREILQHLEDDLSRWGERVEREIRSVRREAVSRDELKNRFARLARAAMDAGPGPDENSP